MSDVEEGEEVNSALATIDYPPGMLFSISLHSFSPLSNQWFRVRVSWLLATMRRLTLLSCILGLGLGFFDCLLLWEDNIWYHPLSVSLCVFLFEIEIWLKFWISAISDEILNLSCFGDFGKKYGFWPKLIGSQRKNLYYGFLFGPNGFDNYGRDPTWYSFLLLTSPHESWYCTLISTMSTLKYDELNSFAKP